MSGRVVIRELKSANEYHETVVVSKEAWKFVDRVLSPWTDLIAGTHAGGMTAGAFEGGGCSASFTASPERTWASRRTTPIFSPSVPRRRGAAFR